MQQQDFESRYQHSLQYIEAVLEDAVNQDLDIDYELHNDILTIECADGSKVIITPQAANAQLWLAARSGGFHFNFDEQGGQWRCSADDRSLGDMLKDICQSQAGVELVFGEL